MALFFIFFLIICGSEVFGANILFLSPVPSPSHHIWNRALSFGLVNHGHNVTLLTCDEDNVKKPTNYSVILLEDIYAGLDDSFDINSMGSLSPYEMMVEFYAWMDFVCEKTLQTKGLKNLLDYPKDHFDLIIYDVTIGYFFYPIIAHFNYAPTVGVSAFLLPQFVSFDFGNPLQTSYLPWYALPYSDNMNFMQRLKNFLYTRLDLYYRSTYVYPKHEKVVRERFGQNTPSLDSELKHISLVLANTDPLLDYPQPMPPNIIPVGGLHTRKPKEIAREYKKILDSAKDGVIIFSLGTNVRSDKLSDQQRKALLGAFAKLKETVIWKFESELEGLPKNVIIGKWLPQNDVLSHPNVKLFIGHGGALSTQEAIYHGKPMILIPFIVDQYINAIRIVDKKLGLSLDFKQLSEDLVYNTIREILDNPIYQKNMETTSARFRDRPETPLERGIFWVEYALRHQGAGFLNTKARDLPYYQFYELDILAFLVLITVVCIIVILTVVKFIYRIIYPKKKVKTQ